MKVLALCLLFACSWTKSEVAAETAALAATVGDWHQTQDITGACTEGNALIGACGQNVPPNYYFPVVMAAHAAVAALLPHRWRLAWSALTLGAEVNQVWMNYEAEQWLSYTQSTQVLTLPLAPPPRRHP